MNRARPLSLLLLVLIVVVSLFQLPFVSAAPQSAPTPMPPPSVKPSTAQGSTSEDGAELPEGWADYEGEGMTIQLPDTFEGGDIKKNLDTIMSVLKSEVPDLASAAEMLEQNPDLFVFWAFDKESKNGFLTNINVIRQELPGAYPMDLILESSISMLPSTFTVLEHEVLTINDVETGRIVMEGEILNASFRTLQYVVIDESNVMWIVSFATGAKEFEDRVEDFDASFETFTLVNSDEA